MITIKDYAKQQGVSYEAIRKQIKRYEKDLEGHLVKQNRFLMLDDEAVRFLDTKRAENPVIIYEQNKDEALEQLRKENKNLLIQMNMVQDEMKQVQQKLIAQMQQNHLLTTEKMNYLEYKSLAEHKGQRLQDLKKERDQAQTAISQQEALLRLKEQQIGALTNAKEMAANTLAALKQELAKEQQKSQEKEAELQRLQHRSFWERLWNR